MDLGTYGFQPIDGMLEMYQRPWIPCAKFVAGQRVSIPYAIPRTPVYVQAYGRCKIAENGFAVGQIVAHHGVYGTSGYAVACRDSDIVITPTAQQGFNLLPLPTGGNVNMTPANWDICFGVFA